MATIGLNNELLLFEKAKTFVRFNNSEFNDEHLLRFYAYDKQASLGDCTERCPKCQFTDLRQKWSAWNCLKGKSQVEAAKLYVSQLDKIIPDWKDPNREKPGCSKSLYAERGDERGNGRVNYDEHDRKIVLSTFLRAVTYVNKHKEDFTSAELIRYLQLHKVATNEDDTSSDEFDDGFQEDEILLWTEEGRKAQRFWEAEKDNISLDNANSIKHRVSVDYMKKKIHQKQLMEILDIANACLEGKINPVRPKRTTPVSKEMQIAIKSNFGTCSDSDSDSDWSGGRAVKGMDDDKRSDWISDSSSDTDYLYDSAPETVPISSEDEYEKELFDSVGKIDISTGVKKQADDIDSSRAKNTVNKKKVECYKPRDESPSKDQKREQAMKTYVRRLSAKFPYWDGKVTVVSEQSTTGPSEMGSIENPTMTVNEPSTVSGVSKPMKVDESEEKTIYDYVKEGDIEMVDGLLIPEKINEPDEMGLTMLHWAADRGQFQIILLLLFNDANANVKDHEGQTPLHYASSCGHRDIVRMLLAHDADLFAKNKDGLTAADMAATNKVLKVLTDPDALFIDKLKKLHAKKNQENK